MRKINCLNIIYTCLQGALANLFYHPSEFIQIASTNCVFHPMCQRLPYSPSVGVVLYYSVVCLSVIGGRSANLVIITNLLVSVSWYACMHPNEIITGYVALSIIVICSTKPPRDSDLASNVTKVIPPTVIPGQFVPDAVCFGDVTQQQVYYIILVSIIILSSQCG